MLNNYYCTVMCTCSWFGKFFMAVSSCWTTVPSRCKGIPSTSSSVVRLKTHAVATSWTCRESACCRIPSDTSCNRKDHIYRNMTFNYYRMIAFKCQLKLSRTMGFKVCGEQFVSGSFEGFLEFIIQTHTHTLDTPKGQLFISKWWERPRSDV